MIQYTTAHSSSGGGGRLDEQTDILWLEAEEIFLGLEVFRAGASAASASPSSKGATVPLRNTMLLYSAAKVTSHVVHSFNVRRIAAAWL